MAEKTGSRLAVPYRLKKKIKKNVFQFLKFKVIGFSNGAIDLVSLNLMLLIWPTKNNWLLLIFNTAAYILAVTNSYIWNSRYTFKQGTEKGMKQKILFVSQAGASLLINNGAFMLGVHLLSLFISSMWIVDNGAKEFSMVCSSNASFLFMKFIVFREKK